MKAVAVFPAAREVRMVEHREPAPAGPAEAALRVLEVGICGTDREITSFQYGLPPLGSHYLVIGHEMLGEVVEVGSEVDAVRPGDLVVPMVRRPCSHESCLACRRGRQDFCYTGDFTERGIKGAHGFMTELVVDDARYFQPVPASTREVAVLLEPLTIAEKALAQVWRVQQRLPWLCAGDAAARQPGECHRALVLGAGPVGILGAMLLVDSGFDTFVYSRGSAAGPKGAIVEAIGATYVPAESCSAPELGRRIGDIDLVYEAIGASRPAFEILASLGTNGVFVFTGVPGRKAAVEFDAENIMRNLVLKNQIVLGTVNAGPDAFAQAVTHLETFMRRWPATLRSLITHRYPAAAFAEPLLGPRSGIKNVLCFT